jgi:hypothetical protein
MLTINAEIGEIIDPSDGSKIVSEKHPSLRYGEKAVFCLSFVDSNLDAYPFGSGDTFEAGGDIDYVSEASEGTLSGSLSVGNAVTSISSSGLDADEISSTGHLRIYNSSNEMERIEYTAYNSSTGTFAVDHTMESSFANGDKLIVEDELMFYSGNEQVDIAGDWDETDRSAGKISIRIDATADSFKEKINSLISEDAYFEIRRYPSGESTPSIICHDLLTVENSVINTGDNPAVTNPQFLTQTSADARYQQKDADAVESNIAIFDTSGNTEDSGYAPSDFQELSEKGQASGYAGLDSSGKVPSSQLPALALTDVYVTASEAEQIALTAQEGDVCVRSDLNKSYVHNGGAAGTMADWQELLTPTDAVLSVAGKTGAVSLEASDIGDFDTEVGNNSDVAVNTAHRGTTSGNPHQVKWEEISDISLASVASGDMHYWDETAQLLKQVKAAGASTGDVPTLQSDGSVAYESPAGGGDMSKSTYDTDDDGAVDMAEGLKETSGPTSLSMGSVSDGQWLKRDGSTIIGGTPAGAGDVTGPASSTDNAIARFDGTGGDTLQDSGVTIDDSNNLDTAGSVLTDTIAEHTADNGVAVDSLTIKDGGFALGSDADGDVYYRSSGALARLAKGTAGQVLKMNTGATAPEWGTGSGGMWTLVERWEPTSSASTYTFSSLNGDTDRSYMLRINIVAGTVTTGGSVFVRPNNDSSASYWIMSLADSGSSSDTGKTGLEILYMTTDAAQTYGTVSIDAKSGKRRIGMTNGFLRITSSATQRLGFSGQVWDDTSTNITSLVFVGPETNCFAVGTVIELWKLAQ